MDIYEAIATRKSVRAFLDKEAPAEVLTRVFEAVRLAPSANNRQEWRFVVVRDPATRKKLVKAACGQTFIATAPVVLACCAETDGRVMTCGQTGYPIDVAIAIDHLTLCAAAEGLGTCWIGSFHENAVKKILGIPPHIRVVGLLPIGYPTDPGAVEKSRISLDRIVTYEDWGGMPSAKPPGVYSRVKTRLRSLAIVLFHR